MRIVVAGWAAGFPVAGFLVHPLGYAQGFAALGHDVWFLDDGSWGPDGYDPETGEVDADGSAGVAFLDRELAARGFAGRWARRHVDGERVSGMSAEELGDVLADADVLLNVSLMLPDRPEYRQVPHRLALDTDPVFTQVSIARGNPIPERHTRLFTMGRPPLPGQAHEWVPTRQAVHLDDWDATTPPDPDAPFTTVTSWKAYPPLEFEGRSYGLKDVSLRAHVDLPLRTDAALSIALAGGLDTEEGADVLGANGWQVTDAIDATRTSEAYRAFLAASAGEIGFAKHAYVAARSGWFSDRTCCYLASGRPAVVQDTGWSDELPTGEGLFAFSTTDEAVAGIEAVQEDPERHGKAARQIVADHFAAPDVCARILEAL